MLPIGTTQETFACQLAISNVQLSLEKVQENVHILSVSFFHELGDRCQPVNFLIRRSPLMPVYLLRDKFCRKTGKIALTIADAYPLNGTVKNRRFKVTDFVRPVNRTEIQQQVQILDEIDPLNEQVRCVVIDFKDVKKRYDCREEIAAAEKKFAAFFRETVSDNGGTQAEIQKLIRDGRIAFFINEGSLKADLIKWAFTPAQSDFFQKDENGSRLLCQLCEVLMNGFKQGCEFAVLDHRYSPNDYITVIRTIEDQEIAVCEEAEFPPIRLLTLYPNYYREAYSHQSAYYRLISNVFRTYHEDKNQTTLITIE